ncbi:MAG: D-3-phosphoglycerate dehydrogenase [Polyangiaceae bacterium]|nr:D-3-phosphoglycerate dehydrogenase [Polyangiaceae bacterium]
MRLLIADPIDTQPLEELRVLGIEVVTDPSLTRETLPAALSGVGILVVRGTEVTAEALDNARELNLIVRAGGGTGNIDVEAASARGIYVANCPGKNAAAVAELTMAMVLALDRRLVDASADFVAGRWERGKYGGEAGLLGRHIGVAGFGAVGQQVLSRARAFGMKPHLASRGISLAKAQKLDVAYAPSFERLASVSDVLTIHLPLNPQTRGAISRHVLEALPHEAIVVNTSRAELFDMDALLELAPKKGLRLGLDVFGGEPRDPSAAFSSPFAKLPNVICTPHIGGSTRQAQRAIAEEVTRIVRSFLTEEDVPNVVNVCAASPARYVIVLRQLDKVGALANTLNVLKRHGINIEEISNTVFDGAKATCTKLRVSGRPSEACLKEIGAFQETLRVDVVPMPNKA